jgi:hypothetical protein
VHIPSTNRVSTDNHAASSQNETLDITDDINKIMSSVSDSEKSFVAIQNKYKLYKALIIKNSKYYTELKIATMANLLDKVMLL